MALWGLLLPAVAVAQPPTTETIHERFDTAEFDTVCSGAVVPIHVIGKSVFHITEFDNGRYHLTGTQVGRFTTTDARVTYRGRFIWFGENSNTKSFNGTFTFNATGPEIGPYRAKSDGGVIVSGRGRSGPTITPEIRRANPLWNPPPFPTF